MQSTEEAMKGCKIIARLVARRVFERKEDPALFDAFLAGEGSELVRMQADAMNAHVACTGNAVYLVPCDGNTVFGYTRAELRDRLVGSAGELSDREARFRIACFAFAVLLMEFYGGTSDDGKLREMLPVSEWQEAVESALNRMAAAERERNESSQDAGDEPQDKLQCADLLGIWNALLATGDAGAKQLDTRKGLLDRVLNLLKSQRLATLSENNSLIHVTTRLDDLVSMELLDRSSSSVMDRLALLIGEKN